MAVPFPLPILVTAPRHPTSASETTFQVSVSVREQSRVPVGSTQDSSSSPTTGLQREGWLGRQPGSEGQGQGNAYP